MVTPPNSSIAFSEISTADQAQQNLINFISSRLSISTDQAAELLGKEGNIEKAFLETEVVEWPAIGQFQKQADGTISFLQIQALNSYLPDILIRQNKQQPEAESFIEIAGPEIPGEVIYELEEPARKDNWWVWAIVILVVSVALILFRFL